MTELLNNPLVVCLMTLSAIIGLIVGIVLACPFAYLRASENIHLKAAREDRARADRYLRENIRAGRKT